MDTTAPAQAQPPVAGTEDKAVAIVSYITIIGFIIAIIIHSSKKTKLGAYHLRQMLGFVLMGIVLYVGLVIMAFIPLVNLLLILVWPVVGIAMLVFWVLGLVAAINGEMKPMPIVGSMFQKCFGTTFD